MNSLTRKEFALYSLLYLKHGSASFDLNDVKWYFSPQMLKKLFFNLTKAGWLKAISRGKYACSNPVEAVKSFFEPRTENILKESKFKYCYFGHSAADVWADGMYKQDSWERKPFFVMVLKKDLKKWKKLFASKQTPFFSEPKQNVLGEFVIFDAVDSFKSEIHNGLPVISLKKTVEFCEKNKTLLEYPLAYFFAKYKVKTSASEEMKKKAKELIM